MATQIMNGNNNLESTTAVKNMDRRVLASGDEQDRTNVAQFCACCLDECPNWDVTQLSCSHFWCRDCAQRLFQASLDSPDDPALFPPRCCDPVPLSACRFFLAPATIKAFTQRTEALAALRGEEEKSTPPQERVYCHRPACSAFVPHSRYRSDPADGEETVAPCPRPGCGASTCVRCKKEAHGDLDCPEDPAFKQLLEVANERGWKQCPRCRRMVEKDSGCNRMICVCGHGFCYHCGKQPCDQARLQGDMVEINQDHLLHTANNGWPAYLVATHPMNFIPQAVRDGMGVMRIPLEARRLARATATAWQTQ